MRDDGMKETIRVAVTGAAGNIGYALLWRIASGDCFGANQPVTLQLLEIPAGMQRLEGVIMELKDSAFPLVHGIVGTDDANTAFKDADAIFLVGSRPRTKDMDRADLVAANGPIFVGQGRAIDAVSSPNVKVITVGNPCNTNALIACANAPSIPSRQFTAMTRLDQNRAVGQMAERAGVPASKVDDVFIWGNHANTMYPDPRFATIDGRDATDVFDQDWLQGDFLGYGCNTRQGNYRSTRSFISRICCFCRGRSHARLVARLEWTNCVNGTSFRRLVWRPRRTCFQLPMSV